MITRFLIQTKNAKGKWITKFSCITIDNGYYHDYAIKARRANPDINLYYRGLEPSDHRILQHGDDIVTWIFFSVEDFLHIKQWANKHQREYSHPELQIYEILEPACNIIECPHQIFPVEELWEIPTLSTLYVCYLLESIEQMKKKRLDKIENLVLAIFEDNTDPVLPAEIWCLISSFIIKRSAFTRIAQWDYRASV